MTDFSLTLNEDQLQIRKWVHDFAEGVVRPAGPRVGRAGGVPLADRRGGRQDRPLRRRLPAQRDLRPHRAHPPRRRRGALLGRRRHRHGDHGLGTRRRRHQRQRHARAGDRVGAPVLRHARQGRPRRVLRERARRRLRRLGPAHPGRVRRGHRRVGAQRHQGVDHQRRHRRRPRRRRRCRSRARAKGHAASWCGPGTKGLSQGQKYLKHGIRASHTAEVVLDDVRVPGSHLLGGKEKLDAKLARAREVGHSGEKQPAM